MVSAPRDPGRHLFFLRQDQGGFTMRAIGLLMIPMTAALLLPASAAEESRPCSAPAYRQFDFWIGEWEVRTPDRALAGTNRITPILRGRGLQENWEGTDGMTGTSLNAYEAARGLWHQTWVDSRGSILLLEGQFKDAKMTLSGSRRSPRGGTVQDRIIWEPVTGGVVAQTSGPSNDGGQSVTAGF